MCYFFPVVERFPKHEKFVLQSTIKNCVLDIARKIIKANKIQNKKPILYDIDVMLEELRLMIRFSHQRKYLSNKKYEHAIKLLNEIGRLLGGWIKKG